MKGRTKTKAAAVDVFADYHAEPFVKNSWNLIVDHDAEGPPEYSWRDDALDAAWLRAFGKYLSQQNDGPSAWAKLKSHGNIRPRLDSIHNLTNLHRPEGTGSTSPLEDSRQYRAKLKEQFRKAGELLTEIEILVAYRHPNVIDILSDPLDWPPERKRLVEWLEEGKELTSRLEKHFKSISHASRVERDDQRFLTVVFVLRHICRCKYSEVASLITSGMLASGAIRDDDGFDQWRLKDHLRNLRRTLPELYREIENDIKALASGRVQKIEASASSEDAYR